MFAFDAIGSELRGTTFARIRYVTQTPSTNDDAARVLGNPDAGGLVFLTDDQQAGRGRRGRPWIAPSGSSLLFTAVLPAAVAAHGLWSVTFWCALGVCDGIEAATGLWVDLQWPNDLLLGGRKCGGMLCTTRVTGAWAWVGCGVGLNVYRPPHATDLDAIVPAPAFLSDAVAAVARDRVLVEILRAFDKRLSQLGHPSSVAREWEQRAALAGTPYRLLVDGTDTPFEALAVRLSDDGGLVVADQAGERTVSLADARALRTDAST